MTDHPSLSEQRARAPKRGDKIKWVRSLNRRPLAIQDAEFVTVASWGLPDAPLAVTLEEVAGTFPMGWFDVPMLEAAFAQPPASGVDREAVDQGCRIPPTGWRCSRERGHEGPCAARQSDRPVGAGWSTPPTEEAAHDERLTAEELRALGLGVSEWAYNHLAKGYAVSLTVREIKRLIAALTNSGAPVPGDGGLRAALAARLASDAAAIDHARKTSGQVESYLAALAYRVEAHLPDILAALAHAAPPPSDGAGGERNEMGKTGAEWDAAMREPYPAPTEAGAPAGMVLVKAATDLLERMSSSYKARNGREVGVQGDDGEKVWLVHSDEIEALRRALEDTPKQATPTDEAVLGDTARLDFLAAESFDLRCFPVPTGGGDADIGWRVVGHWEAEPNERTIAEVFHDDPRAAIDAARPAPGSAGEAGK